MKRTIITVILTLELTDFATQAASAVVETRALASRTLFAILLALCLSTGLSAGELPSDSSTLLLLHLNGNLVGDDGETPSFSSGLTFVPGIIDQGVLIDGSDSLAYPRVGNLDSWQGTIEFWIKPNWDGDNTGFYELFQIKDDFYDYSNHTMWLGKDPGGNLGSWGGIYENVSDLSAGQWYHIAVAWEGPDVILYINGTLRQSGYGDTRDFTAEFFNVGSACCSQGNQVNAVIDELRISNRARTATEIANSFIAGLVVSNISIDLHTTTILPTWWVTPEVTAITNLGAFTVFPAVLEWDSTDEGVANVDSLGRIVAFGGGTATVTGSLNGASDWVDVTVTEPVLQPKVEAIPASLSSLADRSLWEIPVVVLRYLPTADGVNLDVSKCPDFWSLNPITLVEAMTVIDSMDIQVKFSLEEGTRFRGYQTLSTDPSIGYRVVKYVTVFEQTPPGEILYLDLNNFPLYGVNHHSIFERFGIEQLVNVFGVKEIWIWWCGVDSGMPSYDPNLHDPDDFRTGWESNMSSPVTGDISNSNRDNSDLPIYDQTYTVYGQNIRRTQNEAVHNRGHQYEAILSHANWLQDGNSELFWREFVGQNLSGQFITGRSGWTHMPPNTLDHYDYVDMTLVESDIEDWTPEGYGATTLVNSLTWGDIPYSWPQGVVPPGTIEAHWYIYWMQAFPGFGNGIPYSSDVMTNWWTFVGDWDRSITRGIGLYGSGVCPVDDDLVLADQTITTGQDFEACESIFAGPNVIIDSLESVRFISGHTITLGNGFVVKTGAAFSAEIDPTIDPY